MNIRKTSKRIATAICKETLRKIDLHDNPAAKNIHTFVVHDIDGQFVFHVRYQKKIKNNRCMSHGRPIDDHLMFNANAKDESDLILEFVTLVKCVLNNESFMVVG